MAEPANNKTTTVEINRDVLTIGLLSV